MEQVFLKLSITLKEIISKECLLSMESIHISPVRATGANWPVRNAVPIRFVQTPEPTLWPADELHLTVTGKQPPATDQDLTKKINLPPGFFDVRAMGLSGVVAGGSGPIQQANLYQLMRLWPKWDAEVGVGFEKRDDKTMNKSNAGVRYYIHQGETWAPYVGAGATYASSHVLRQDPPALGGYLKVGTEYFLDREWAMDVAIVGQSLFGLKGQGHRHTVGASVGLNYHFDR